MILNLWVFLGECVSQIDTFLPCITAYKHFKLSLHFDHDCGCGCVKWKHISLLYVNTSNFNDFEPGGISLYVLLYINIFQIIISSF